VRHSGLRSYNLPPQSQILILDSSTISLFYNHGYSPINAPIIDFSLHFDLLPHQISFVPTINFQTKLTDLYLPHLPNQRTPVVTENPRFKHHHCYVPGLTVKGAGATAREPLHSPPPDPWSPTPAEAHAPLHKIQQFSPTADHCSWFKSPSSTVYTHLLLVLSMEGCRPIQICSTRHPNSYWPPLPNLYLLCCWMLELPSLCWDMSMLEFYVPLDYLSTLFCQHWLYRAPFSDKQTNFWLDWFLFCGARIDYVLVRQCIFWTHVWFPYSIFSLDVLRAIWDCC
jgi:hypothetical protein